MRCKICGNKAHSEYCFRHKPRKRISPISKKKQNKVDKTAELNEMHLLFQKIWNEQGNKKRCWSCDNPIYGDISSLYFHHLLPKSKFPEYKLEKDNIFFCCWECHDKTERGFPPEPIKKATDDFKRRIEQVDMS